MTKYDVESKLFGGCHMKTHRLFGKAGVNSFGFFVSPPIHSETSHVKGTTLVLPGLGSPSPDTLAAEMKWLVEGKGGEWA